MAGNARDAGPDRPLRDLSADAETDRGAAAVATSRSGIVTGGGHASSSGRSATTSTGCAGELVVGTLIGYDSVSREVDGTQGHSGAAATKRPDRRRERGSAKVANIQTQLGSRRSWAAGTPGRCSESWNGRTAPAKPPASQDADRPRRREREFQYTSTAQTFRRRRRSRVGGTPGMDHREHGRDWTS